MADENGPLDNQIDPQNADTETAVGKDTQNGGIGDGGADERSQTPPPADPFADLPGDTREWLKKREVKDPLAAAKLAHDQAKLLGNAIRVPGKNATEEERNEFLNKLGRPAEAGGYEFKVPKDLPEEMPYDAERAGRFRDAAHKMGLSQEQAAGLHDWFASEMLGEFKTSGEKQMAQAVERAKAETDKLVKLWGPLDGQTARANLELADRFINLAGGPAALAEMQRAGFIGPNKEILSEPLAVMFAKAGQAIFSEDSILKGRADQLNNPFADGEHFNMTTQSVMIKNDRDRAISLIYAAGKKPADFGLKE